jgi:hypothetical protein
MGRWWRHSCLPRAVLTKKKVRLSSWSDRGEPSGSELEAFLIDHGLQTATLLRLGRSRPAELRLFRLLLWIGERFGLSGSRAI